MADLGDVDDYGGNDGPLLKRPRGLTGFLTRTRVALKSAIWQVCFIGSGFVIINIAGQVAPSSSHHTLPRNHPVHHLYEYNVPEEVFNAHMADIAADLVHPEVEGVYELHVPSLFRLLTRLGCLCAVTKRSTSSGSTTTSDSFSLDQLEF
ncbi:unnamed protein product, partial [Dibothriocephalus latus]